MESDIIVHGKEKDLGGFSVVRSLPTIKCRSVGHFVFLDHMGPIVVTQDQHLDVRPHPHIGLMTVTYLLEGRGYHRDSLGSKQIISAGDVNLMIAGRGIVHSERTPPEEIKNGSYKSMHGVQIWVALPKEAEQCDPAFFHYPAKDLPHIKISDKVNIYLLMGEYQGYRSPVKIYTSTLFLMLSFDEKVDHQLSFIEDEVGILIVSGSAIVNNQTLRTNDFIKVKDSKNIEFQSLEKATIAVIGGQKLQEPRYMWWNLVSSDKELIKEAAIKWKNQEMGKIEGETDFIPLPNDPLP